MSSFYILCQSDSDRSDRSASRYVREPETDLLIKLTHRYSDLSDLSDSKKRAHYWTLFYISSRDWSTIETTISIVMKISQKLLVIFQDTNRTQRRNRLSQDDLL